jgi:hypothetical protein
MIEVKTDSLDDKLRQFVKRMLSAEHEVGGVVVELDTEVMLFHGSNFLHHRREKAEAEMCAVAEGERAGEFQDVGLANQIFPRH